MPKSFSIKTIKISVTLDKGNFSGNGNTKIFEGFACDVSVTKAGLPQLNGAAVNIYGLNMDTMKQLTVLGPKPLESNHNVIKIEAGDKDTTLALVYQGEITLAYADFSKAPNPFMHLEAGTGSNSQQKASSPTTVKGEAKADRFFAQFAKEAGYSYENQGVTSSVKNAVFSGSPIDKLQKLANDVGCDLIIDDGHVIVLPFGQPRKGIAVSLNEGTGLIGYPQFTNIGITCNCLFNPNLTYGGLIKVKSTVPGADGVWRVSKLEHHLTAYMPSAGATTTPGVGTITTTTSTTTGTGTGNVAGVGTTTTTTTSTAGVATTAIASVNSIGAGTSPGPSTGITPGYGKWESQIAAAYCENYE